MRHRDSKGSERSTRVVSLTWLRASRSLRRVKQALPVPHKRRRPGSAGSGDRGLDPTVQPAPAEVGALHDLGLSEGAVAAYLLDRSNVAEPRRRSPAAVPPLSGAMGAMPPSRAPVLYRALDRVSAAAMRQQARQLIFAARRSDDPEQRTSLAERAFEVAQAAEQLEHRTAAAAAAARAGMPQGANDDDPGASLRARAKRWHLRAEEYRTVADALQPGAARESYLHLARAYDTLADQFLARARLRSRSETR